MLYRRVVAALIVAVAFGAMGAGCGTKEAVPSVTASSACSAAWDSYGAADSDHYAHEESPGTATLNDCSTPAEWWVIGQEYRLSAKGKNRSMDEVLDDWCQGEDEHTTVCQAR